MQLFHSIQSLFHSGEKLTQPIAETPFSRFELYSSAIYNFLQFSPPFYVHRKLFYLYFIVFTIATTISNTFITVFIHFLCKIIQKACFFGRHSALNLVDKEHWPSGSQACGGVYDVTTAALTGASLSLPRRRSEQPKATR